MPRVKVIVHSFLQRQQLIDRIEHIQTPLEWDGWEVDQSSVAELETWFRDNGNSKWAKFAGEVNGALQSKVVDMLQDHIPDGPVPVKSLAKGLISLVKLAVVCYFHLSFSLQY
jgi:hypothetical protein